MCIIVVCCPVCTEDSHCNNHGKCLHYMCDCDKGFGGANCEIEARGYNSNDEKDHSHDCSNDSNNVNNNYNGNAHDNIIYFTSTSYVQLLKANNKC